MWISTINLLWAEQQQRSDSPVNQASYAELDELAVPEFSRLYFPIPSTYLDNLPTIISTQH